MAIIEWIRKTGSIVTISVTTLGVLWYFAGLDEHISQLEKQMRSLAVSSGAIAGANDRLNERISQLDERMRSLATLSVATMAAVNKLSRKPLVEVNPVLQKCGACR